MSLKKLLLICTALALLSACRGAQDSGPLTLTALYENPAIEGFQKADQPVTLEFPRDHGAHLDFQTEWWYVVGIVSDANDRSFGFQFTLFRQALTPNGKQASDWQSGQLFMAHFAIADIQGHEHTSFERFSRGHPQLAGVELEPFRAFLEDWSMSSSHPTDLTPLELRVKEEQFALDLTLIATKPPVPHGESGLSKKSPTNASYYYSIPRIQTAGTLATPKGSFNVSGDAWLDREWSTGVIDANYQGWHWLALHLEDGRDLVFFNLTPKSDEIPLMPVGMLVKADGTRERLDTNRWSLEPRRHWGSWPVAWHLELDGEPLKIEAAFDDQLMSTSLAYWEGVVFVHVAEQQVGSGYLELTGY